MAGRPRVDEWYSKAAEHIIWEGVSPQEAADREGHTLTGEEAAKLVKLPAFQRVLARARNEFYSEIGRSPTRTKSVVLGRLDTCAQKLMENQQWDKAASVLLQLSKVEGWVGSETEVSVFAGLSQKEIDEVRARITRQQQQPQVN